MKNKLFIWIFIVAAAFISCSKQDLTLGKSRETAGTEKFFPINRFGGIAGTLMPTPLMASLKFYNEVAKYEASCNADQTGYFKIGTLIPGSYDITVAYVWNANGNAPVYDEGNGPVYEWRYFELKGVKVEAGLMNELGDVVLVPR